MKFLVTITFSLLFLCSYAQRKHDNIWHKGQIVLNTNDTLMGLIRYNFGKNVVQFKQGKEQRILLPGKFTSLTYRDTYDSTSHTFQVHYIKTARDYNRPYFFEPVDTSGRVKLYKQFYWVERASSFGGASFFADINTVKVTQLFYKRKGKIVTQLDSRKRDVLRALKDKKHEIKTYAKENGLRFNTNRNVINIITYYNSLF